MMRISFRKFFLLLCGALVLFVINIGYTDVLGAGWRKHDKLASRHAAGNMWGNTSQSNARFVDDNSKTNVSRLTPASSNDVRRRFYQKALPVQQGSKFRHLTKQKLKEHVYTGSENRSNNHDTDKNQHIMEEPALGTNSYRDAEYNYRNLLNDKQRRPMGVRPERGNPHRDSRYAKWKPVRNLRSDTGQRVDVNNEVITKSELQKLLQAELEADNPTDAAILPEAEVNQVFESAGKTILIIAYHRTGSTLLGTTFQVNPGTFYMFEPYHLLQKTDSLTFLNGTIVYDVKKSYTRFVSMVLQSLTSCQLDALPLELLMDNHHVHYKDSLESCVYCLQRFMTELTGEQQAALFESNLQSRQRAFSIILETISDTGNASAILKSLRSRCLEPVIDMCRQASVRVYKFITLRMHQIQNILRDTDDVSVVHLLRDPRGNIVSQSRLLIPSARRLSRDPKSENIVRNSGYLSKFVSIARSYCNLVRDDINWKNKYLTQYKNRIYTVQYETFASTPLETAKQMYKFADLNFSSLAESFLWHFTMSGEQTRCSYCVERGNSTSSAYSWRKFIGPAQLRVINEVCRDIYGMLGLREIQSIADIRNNDLDPAILKAE